jgi:hypothetical protein
MKVTFCCSLFLFCIVKQIISYGYVLQVVGSVTCFLFLFITGTFYTKMILYPVPKIGWVLIWWYDTMICNLLTEFPLSIRRAGQRGRGQQQHPHRSQQPHQQSAEQLRVQRFCAQVRYGTLHFEISTYWNNNWLGFRTSVLDPDQVGSESFFAGAGCSTGACRSGSGIRSLWKCIYKCF